jgi:hypothetical protein
MQGFFFSPVQRRIRVSKPKSICVRRFVGFPTITSVNGQAGIPWQERRFVGSPTKGSGIIVSLRVAKSPVCFIFFSES